MPLSHPNERDHGRVVTVGSRLGQYQVAFELARGGMATVYMARTIGRAGLHRFVALKCIRNELARDPGFVDMFYDEAEIASQIHHPNVCGVLDFDEHEGIYFLAMELLAGQTLTRVMQSMHERPQLKDPLFQAGLACRLLSDACEGLHAAHELSNARGEPLNIVHRDVAPDNLFVTYDGNLKVLDFGVASATHQHHKTSTGMIKGKCSYLSPEVLKGKKADRRADVWGLGVTAWEMLTHRKLFKGESDLETFRAICTGAIPSPSATNSNLPPALDAIILKALERKPDARYQTTRELGRALNGFLVENKLAIGLADVAETMTDLFPEGRTYTRKLFQVADQIDAASGAHAVPSGLVNAPEADARDVKLVSPAPPPLPKRHHLALRWKMPGAPALLAAGALLVAVAALVVSASGRVVPLQSVRAPLPAAEREAPPAPEPYRLDVAPVSSSTPGEVVLRLQVAPRIADVSVAH
jgi:serine/threonine-protein kinase